jgi:hypothetical protein
MTAARQVSRKVKKYIKAHSRSLLTGLRHTRYGMSSSQRLSKRLTPLPIHTTEKREKAADPVNHVQEECKQVLDSDFRKALVPPAHSIPTIEEDDEEDAPIPLEWKRVVSDSSFESFDKLCGFFLCVRWLKTTEELIHEAMCWHELAEVLNEHRGERFGEFFFRLRKADRARADGGRLRYAIGFYWYQVCKITLYAVESATSDIHRPKCADYCIQLLPYIEKCRQIMRTKRNLSALVPVMARDIEHAFFRTKCVMNYLVACNPTMETAWLSTRGADTTSPEQKRMDVLWTVACDAEDHNIKEDFVQETVGVLLPGAMHKWFASIGMTDTAEAVLARSLGHGFDKADYEQAYQHPGLSPKTDTQFTAPFEKPPKESRYITSKPAIKSTANKKAD